MTPEQIQAVEDEFLARLDAGDDPDPEEVVLAHPPEAARELRDRLVAAYALHAEARHRPVIDGYELYEPLGRGGEAVVYRATDTRSGFEVAVKVFAGGSPARFQREVVALTKLNHPHIVQLLTSGVTADGRPYLTMHLFPKRSLDRRFPAGRAPDPADVAELTATLADAADAAHQLGVIHRDIKPSNVLLDAADRPRLSDFGLALVADETAVTRPGTVLGSYLYMAPEQARGDGHHATVRTDVYGLGTVLYWLLTGKPPFAPAQPLELIRRVTADPPRPPRVINPTAPPGLERICLKCLEKNPTDRYPTAAALATALRDWVAGKNPRGPGPLDRLRKWWRQRSPAFRAVTVAAGVILTVLVASGFWVRGANRQSDLDRQAKELAERAAHLAETEKAVVAEARARVAVRTALDRGWQLLRAKQAGWTPKLHSDLAEVYRESRELPDDAREAARLEARSLYAMSLAGIDIEPVAGRLAMPSSNFAAWPAVPHPDGKWIAVGTPQGPFRFQPGEEPKKPEELAAPPPGQGMPRLTYRADGEVLAFAPATGGLQLWDGTVSRKLDDLDAGGTPVLAVGFAPGVVRACRADGRVISWGIGGRKVSESVGELTAARFTADASRLAVGDKTGRVRELTADGKPVREWVAPGVRTEVQALAWRPDGTSLAAGFKEGVVIVCNKDGVEHRFAAFNNGVEVLDYSADGAVLSAFRTAEPAHWWDADTGERLLTSEGRRHTTSPDGRTAAASDGYWVELARWVRSDVVRVLRGHRTTVDQLVWPASGDFLASLDARREVRVWHAASGRLIDRFEAPVGEFFAANAGLALSPDGRFLAYACGGPPGTKGFALIRDTTTHTTLPRWDLPAGFDRIAWESGNRFLLVREEFVGETQVLETVVRRLEPDRPPTDDARVLRRSRPTDIHRFLDAILSTDGRHYIWYGPREPEHLRRAEVYDVATGDLLVRCEPQQPSESVQDVRLAPWRGLLRIENGDAKVWKLPATAGEGATSVPPADWFREDRWFAQNESGRASPSVFPPGKAEPWFRLWRDTTDQEGSAHFAHGPDARRLAWATRNGTIFTADLNELANAVERFEAAHR